MTTEDTVGADDTDGAIVSLDNERRRRQPRASFAPAVIVPGGGGLLDQIVAFLGRRPGWPELP